MFGTNVVFELAYCMDLLPVEPNPRGGLTSSCKISKVYGRFPDGYFPGLFFSRKDVSRKVVSRVVIFPDDYETFPGKTS